MTKVAVTLLDIHVIVENVGNHVFALRQVGYKWHYRIEGNPPIDSRTLYPLGYKSQETARRAVKRQISRMKSS